MRKAIAALATVAVVASAGCSNTTNSSSQQSVDSIPSPSQSAQPESRTLTEAGLTVSVPRDCRTADAGATEKAPKTFNCSGLRRLKVARMSPAEDLIRPGIYRGRGGWVGLRVVDTSYVYALAEKRDVLRSLLSSIKSSRS